MRASRALAACQRRDYVTPEDVKDLAVPVLAHRLIVTADAVMSGRSNEAILSELLLQTPVPVTRKT